MRKIAILVIFTLILASTIVLAAQVGPEIPWWSVDGGAQSSSGDPFTLSGIIGQPDAGLAMSGGDYSIVGGYWSAAERPGPEPDESVFLPMVIR